MKFLIMFSIFFVSVASQAFTLTKEEEKKVLRLLKKYCQKVWCQGDYKFRFRAFKCKENRKQKTRCTLRFNADKHFTKGFTADQAKYLTVAAVRDTYSAQCAFTNKEKSQIFLNGEELAKDFYKDVNKCVNSVEEILDTKLQK